MITTRREIREKVILDYYYTDLPNSTQKEKKIRKGVIKRIMKEQKRNHDFQYMTNYIRKGERGSLRTLHIKDAENNIIKILNNRYNIESTIMEHNRVNTLHINTLLDQ